MEWLRRQQISHVTVVAGMRPFGECEDTGASIVRCTSLADHVWPVFDDPECESDECAVGLLSIAFSELFAPGVVLALPVSKALAVCTGAK